MEVERRGSLVTVLLQDEPAAVAMEAYVQSLTVDYGDLTSLNAAVEEVELLRVAAGERRDELNKQIDESNYGAAGKDAVMAEFEAMKQRVVRLGNAISVLRANGTKVRIVAPHE